MLRVALFDCDGTLVDSQGHITAALSATAEAAGRPAPAPEAARAVIGLSLPAALARLHPDMTPDQRTHMAELFRQAWRDLRPRYQDRTKLFPGIAEILGKLADSDLLLGVVTGASRRGLAETLARHELAPLFQVTRTADDGPGKPHPAMVRAALTELGATPSEAVVIGDTTYDMEMARAAGSAALGVSWGYHAPAALSRAGAGRILAEAGELPAAIADSLDPGRNRRGAAGG